MKRILIISGGLQIGGAERVAANLSLYAPENEFEFHYLIFDGVGNDYGPEIERAGGRVISAPSPSKGYGAYIRFLHGLMRENRYCAVHSHTMFNSGLNLAIAKFCEVPVRIAHSHTTKTEVPVGMGQKAYEAAMRSMIRLCATHSFACGVEAGKWLFGSKWFSRHGKVVFNGIPTKEFAYSASNRASIRNELKLTNSFVIGHAASLLPLKNQEFLISLMPSIRQKKPNAKLILLGGGTQEETTRLQNLAKKYGVEHDVVFCGPVFNVHEYLSAFDVFVLPSLREGTPLALLEAQTNGLACVVSDAVPEDAFLTNLVQALPLADRDAWICAICGSARNQPERYEQIMARTGYGADTAYGLVYEAYRGRMK